jgi:hypothetical protein
MPEFQVGGSVLHLTIPWMDSYQMEIQVQLERDVSDLITIKASSCAWGLGVFMIGFGLKLYTAGEVLSSLMLSGVVVLSLGLPATIVLIIWHAAKSVAAWAKVPSRNPTLLTCQTAELARPQATE